MKILLRFFFRLLYHEFAFTYDLVAATVSFNRWKDWVMSVLPFLDGQRILEMGHGPGHLQRVLLSRGMTAIGIDESPQMGRLAKRNLRRGTSSQANLTRGLAQRLPFPNEVFDTVIATFPTEYITEADTLSEVRRCLVNGGRLIVLPVALPRNPLLDWLFKVTHQSPRETLAVIQSRLREPFIDAGFTTEVRALDVKSGILLVVLATKLG